jgi:RimJ/RimL family protein N-acetyltransferase
MVPKKVKITRIEDGIKKDYILRRFEKRDVDRIFQAWNNPQSYRYNSVDWCKRNVESIVDLPWPSDWGMYFMVLEDMATGEILSTCRFGGNPEETKPVWDFGYCTFRGDDKERYTLVDIREVLENGVKTDSKCWGKGYSSMMLDAIIKIAQDEGVYEIISGADGRNLGSQKVMMKNGMTFSEFEDDGDVEFSIKLRGDNGDILPINKLSKDKLDDMWESHMDMVKIKLSDKNIKKLIECSDEKLIGEYIMYLLLNILRRIYTFAMQKGTSVSVIGGADGPTSIFIAGKVGGLSNIIYLLSLVVILVGVIILIYMKKKK